MKGYASPKGPSKQVLEITDFGSLLVQQSPFFPKFIKVEEPVEEITRNEKGQFVKGVLPLGRIRKGEHRGISTEFKKGGPVPRLIKKGMHASPTSEFQPAIWRKGVDSTFKKRTRTNKKTLMLIVSEDVERYLSSHGNSVNQ